MAPSCYYTCSLVPVSFLAAAGYRPVRLMPREPLVQSSSRSLLSPHSMTCPYVTRLLPLAEGLLDEEAESRVVIPSGCDAMRRGGDLLSAAFPRQVFALPVPRAGGPQAARTLAEDLGRMARWLEDGGPAEPFTGQGEPATIALGRPVAPGGVFVISGPLDSPALLELLAELGAQISGLESCSSEERQRSLERDFQGQEQSPGQSRFSAALDAEKRFHLAQTLLETAICPRRPAAVRQTYLRSRWDECRPGAVLYARHSFCDPGAYDALEVAALAVETGLPFMEVEIGLPLELSGPLRTRIEAFLETLLLDL